VARPLGELDSDPWGKPYRLTMKKLRPWTRPLTEQLDEELLEDTLQTLFPAGRPEEARRMVSHEEEDDMPEVTNAELTTAVKQIKSGIKAPGPDGIPATIVVRTLDVMKEPLRKTLTKCLQEGKVPEVWKTAKLILLPKPGKPPGQPSSYRPICLIDELGKLLERLLANRLRNHMEATGNQLSPDQFGFRTGHSTIDAIKKVQERTEEAIGRNRVVLAVSLDIKNAFNSITTKGILQGLIRKQTPKSLYEVLKDYLLDRSATFN